jgi:hypothetical protein
MFEENDTPRPWIFANVKRWSDVAFVEWETQAAKRELDIRGLEYVFPYEISSQKTLNVITVLKEEEEDLPWPGKLIIMRDGNGGLDLDGLAMLGSPNGYGVAYLLLQHQAQFGRRTIQSVQVWSGPDGDYYAYFRIMPVLEGD